MQQTLSIGALAALSAFGAHAQAQDITARVISATPVVQQMQVPRTVCTSQAVAVQRPSSGAGAVIGAIAGGLLGGGIGAGFGQVAATGLGIVAGAAVGDQLERGPGPAQFAQGCSTQTFAENRTVGYDVVYEHGGRQHSVRLASDPGQSLRLQLAPVGAMAQAPGYPAPGYQAPSNPAPTYSAPGGQVLSAPAGIVSVPAVVAGAQPVYEGYASAPGYSGYPGYTGYGAVYPAAVYSAPVYSSGYHPGYAPSWSYYPPVALSLGFGFSNWGHRHGHRGHRHHGHGHRHRH